MSTLRNILVLVAALIGLLLVVPVVVLGLPFLAVSYLVGLIASWLEPAYVKWPDIFEFDSTLGWRAKGNLDCHCLEERGDIFHVKTDSDGWPGRARIAESDVIVFGDSHAFGYGVNHERAFSELNPALRIKAIGVPGYNMVQELLLMERLAPEFVGKTIVWFTYIGNDLYDNLSPEMNGIRAPFLRQTGTGGTWNIVSSHLAPAAWTCSAGAKTMFRNHYPMKPALHSDSALARRAYAACEALIGRGWALCHQMRARLIVMSIPDAFSLEPEQIEKARAANPLLKALEADYPDKQLQAICDKVGVQFVPLKHYLNAKDYQLRNDHWDERGHRRVAKVFSSLHLGHVGSGGLGARPRSRDRGHWPALPASLRRSSINFILGDALSMTPHEQPLVTVLTPAYNGGKYMAECIESVLAQTYDNWEYFIVDNCSRDNTLHIAKTYAARDARIHVVSNQTFVGRQANHNLAFGYISSNSKYCKVVHADDWLFPECLTKMVQLAEANPTVGIVGSYGLSNTDMLCVGLDYRKALMSGQDLCRQTLLGGPYLCGTPTSMLIRSNEIRRRPKLYNELNEHADYEACFDILRDRDFGFVHQVLTYTRVHSGTASVYADRIICYILGVLEVLTKYGRTYLSAEEFEEQCRLFWARYYTFLGLKVFRNRENEFWKFHRRTLSRLGYSLRLQSVAKAACIELLHLALNPLHTSQRIIATVKARLCDVSNERQSPDLSERNSAALFPQRKPQL